MPEIIVKVQQGKLKGQSDIDIYGNTYYSFLGIPYAKPPVGPLRFKDPEPPESWKDVRDATVSGSQCYCQQIDMSPDTTFKFSLRGSEDCLFLNVFTHELSKNASDPKPVMVFIHGGAFTAGSMDMGGPKILMSEDIVFVSINYRLGAFGFLSMQHGDIGNAGMKDTVQALKWIKDNIENFGGDPNNVTIFGISAGGAAVHYLVLSPLAKGLFHKAIAQSGNALNCWAQGKTNNYLDLARTLGCTEKDDEKILKFLQEVSKEKLFEGQMKLGDYFDASRVRYFSPTVERKSESAFLFEDPVKAINSGHMNEVPFIMGYTSAEGICFCDESEILKDSNFLYNKTHLAPFFLGYDINTDIYNQTNKKIARFYFGSDIPDIKNLTASINVATDNLFLRGIYSAVRDHGRTSRSPVYLYRFSAETKLGPFKITRNIKEPGSCHGDDTGYLLKSIDEPKIVPGTLEHLVMKRIVKMWTNFAKSGIPIPAKDTLFDVIWDPVCDGKINYLEIGNQLKSGVNPDKERMEFWDEIYKVLPDKY